MTSREPALATVLAPDAILSTPCSDADPEDPEVVALARAMVAYMRSQPGCVGLAANQVGHGLRLLVVDVGGARKARSHAGLIVLVNPELVEAGETTEAREGCLSVPDLTGDVARPSTVVVRGTVPGSGAERVVEADALEARALQHELDHLAGQLFIDRVAGAHALHARKRYL